MSDSSSGASSTPSPSPSPTATDHRQLTRQARHDLQAFLDLWSSTSLSVAARRYLDPSEQASGLAGNLRLTSGRVSAIRLISWRSNDNFTVMVELDMRFSGGSAAWTNGNNTRFVTASRASAGVPFRYEFATSP